jgi:hypothetical protein
MLKEKNMPSGPAQPREPSPHDVNAPANLTTHPVIDRIRPQLHDQRSYTELVGYVGTIDTKARTVQVYPQLDMRTYLVIPLDAIAFSEPVNPDQKSSPTKLVIDASAKIEAIKSYKQSHEAGFLCGAIAAANLKSASAHPSPAAGSPAEAVAIALACPRPNFVFGPAPPKPPSQCGGNPCATDPLYLFEWER